MNLNADTLKILQNFQTINPSIVFQEGNVLETISTGKSVWAKAEVTNTFPSEFAVYDLKKFLGALSLFENPEIEILDKYMKIHSGKQTMKYFFSDPALIDTPPKKELKFPTENVVNLSLTTDVFELIGKAMRVLMLPNVAFCGEDGKLIVKAFHPEEVTNDVFSEEIGETDQKFQMVFKWDNLNKIVVQDYSVKISPKGISHFTADKLQYFITVESKYSKFES